MITIPVLPRREGLDGALAIISLHLGRNHFQACYVGVKDSREEFLPSEFDVKARDDQGNQYSFIEYSFHNYVPEVTIGFLKFEPSLSRDASLLTLTLIIGDESIPIAVPLNQANL